MPVSGSLWRCNLQSCPSRKVLLADALPATLKRGGQLPLKAAIVHSCVEQDEVGRVHRFDGNGGEH
jgi:hypothetical protein